MEIKGEKGESYGQEMITQNVDLWDRIGGPYVIVPAEEDEEPLLGLVIKRVQEDVWASLINQGKETYYRVFTTYDEAFEALAEFAICAKWGEIQ